MCRVCYDLSRGVSPLDNLGEKIKNAQKSGDWTSLADGLSGVIEQVARGEMKATAAQGSLLKHILDRAYGRVTKAQEDKQGPVGVVVLPTLDKEGNTHVCKRCLEAHQLHD